MMMVNIEQNVSTDAPRRIKVNASRHRMVATVELAALAAVANDDDGDDEHDDGCVQCSPPTQATNFLLLPLLAQVHDA